MGRGRGENVSFAPGHKELRYATGPPASSARLGALGPALQSPLERIQVLLKHVVAADVWDRVLVDDVLVRQAGLAVVAVGDDLQNNRRYRKDTSRCLYQTITFRGLHRSLPKTRRLTRVTIRRGP